MCPPRKLAPKSSHQLGQEFEEPSKNRIECRKIAAQHATKLSHSRLPSLPPHYFTNPLVELGRPELLKDEVEALSPSVPGLFATCCGGIGRRPGIGRG